LRGASKGRSTTPELYRQPRDDVNRHRIIDHQKLRFVADKPPAQVSEQVALMTAESPAGD